MNLKKRQLGKANRVYAMEEHEKSELIDAIFEAGKALDEMGCDDPPEAYIILCPKCKGMFMVPTLTDHWIQKNWCCGKEKEKC